MSANHTTDNQQTVAQEEHRSVNGVNAKAVIPYYFDGTNLVPGGGGIVPQGYDSISIPSYDSNGNPLTVLYYSGGIGGILVATLTLTYAGTNVSTVVRT